MGHDANLLIDKNLAANSWPGTVRALLSQGGAVGSRAKLRVPNPNKPVKGRLDAGGVKVHRVKRRYRRRPKHPLRRED